MATTEGHPKKRALRVERGRRRRRLIVAFVVVALFYPVVGTLTLMTGLAERLLASEDLRVVIDNPAWTIIPGRVHLSRVRIYGNGETQFELDGKDISFEVRLLELLKKRIYVAQVLADDVRYRMRVQVASTKGIEERLAAYPKLEGLPGDPTILLSKAQKVEKREGDFTVEVEGIDVKVSELWFMEYRYVGDGKLQGGFMIGPNRMRVHTSVQELGPGELRFGPDQVIAKRFRGRIETAIPEVDPEEHADASFLELVDAKIHLLADVVTLSHLRAYLDGMRVEGGAGPFDARLSLAKGRLGEGSRLTFRTEDVNLLGNGFSVKTDWDLDMRVARAAPQQAERSRPKPKDDAALPRLRSTSDATYVSFANRRGDVFTVQVRDHEESATLVSTQLGSMTDIEHALLSFPEIVTQDMDDLAALTAGDEPEAPEIRTKSGSARASLVLEIDREHVARGPFRLDFDGVRLVAAGVRLHGAGRAAFGVRIDLDDRATTLSDIDFMLRDVGMHVGDEHVEDWWMKISSKRLAAWGLPPKRLETEFLLRAKDAEPILEALAEKDKLNDLIAKFTSLDDLSMKAAFRKNGSTTDVVVDPLESDVFDAAGRFHAKGDKTRFAFVIGGKAVSLGIASDGTSTSLAPFAKTDWLNAQLRDFPPPIDQVSPPEP